MKPFSEVESLRNLQNFFPIATENDGVEFHRLTGGNPRVQANALAVSHQTAIGLLSSFGQGPMTVEMQIEQQLYAAVLNIKEIKPLTFRKQLTPFVLALQVFLLIYLRRYWQVLLECQLVLSSFVADLGRPLWISDSSVQFRDEPTETWFRKTYLAQKENYLSYIARLEPLASDSTYVAEVLPQLYLQAGEYDKLIKIALSDDLLPTSNPIIAFNF